MPPAAPPPPTDAPRDAPPGAPPDAELPFSPAADRNKAVLLAELQRRLGPTARVIEIASGTGQHAQHFAGAQPGWAWQPTDIGPERRAAVDARCRGLPNVAPARALDVLSEADWAALAAAAPGRVDALYCANLLHIAPWPVCAALMQGAAARLAPAGLLFVYGPFRVPGVPTAPSNEAFDADLRARDPLWGLRDLAEVEAEAARAGLALREALEMPANNRLLVFAPAGAAQPKVPVGPGSLTGQAHRPEGR